MLRPKDRRHRRGGLRVRVIECQLADHPDGETYRLMTTLLEPGQAPAEELARFIRNAGNWQAPSMNCRPTCAEGRQFCTARRQN